MGRNLRFASSALRIAQSSNAELPKTLFPLDYNRLANSNLPCSFYLAEAISPVEDDPSSPVVPEGCRRSIYDGAQCTPLLRANDQCPNRSCHGL